MLSLRPKTMNVKFSILDERMKKAAQDMLYKDGCAEVVK